MTDIRYSYDTVRNKLTIHKDDNYVISLPEVEISQDQFLEFAENVTVGKKYCLQDGMLVLDAEHDDVLKRKKIIRDRNGLLFTSDWAVLPDVPMSEQKRNEWVTYRQQLRDITLDPNFPNVTLPQAPTR